MDTLTPQERSALMARVRGKDTQPEFIVRRLLHRLGHRYRLHAKELPGKPDIVFRPRRKAIFVHGCFWHRHAGCRLAFTPKTREDFWNAKFAQNVARDAHVVAALKERGWSVLVIWQCETRKIEELAVRIIGFLGPAGREK